MNKLPTALAPLAQYRQFINWRPADAGNGKTTKRPLQSVTDPTQWMSWDAAAATGHGVGFVFTESDPFYFLDIDNAWDGKQWSPMARALCAAFEGAAVEISQSGRGIHIIGANGQAPPHSCRNAAHGLELYTQDRFVALTGTHARGDASTSPPGALERLINQYFPPGATTPVSTEPLADTPDPAFTCPDDDETIIARMLKSQSAAAVLGGKASAAALWHADADALGVAFPDPAGVRPYDASAADAALCQHLAFWTGKHPARIDRLFRMSGLYRDKWADRPDYVSRTVNRAVSLCREIYTGGRPTPSQMKPVAASPGQPVQAVNTDDLYYLAVEDQKNHFRGCVYVRDAHRVFLPDGALLKPEQFRATFAGHQFALDLAGEKTTFNAWEAFSENRGHRFPQVHATCFRPELPPATIITRENQELINVYIPIETKATPGDPAPFLDLMAKLLPVDADRQILLAYMAAVVQYPGVKFQWAPLLQGTEGNGKTFLVSALSHAVGERYTHLPNAEDISNVFNAWILNKLFIGIEEIYVQDRVGAIETLKKLITNARIDIHAKGINQETGDNRANFILCSNHKDGIRKHGNDRRFCVFYTAQQSHDDIIKCGMAGNYFPDLYKWARDGGFAIVNHYLRNYPIPPALNPAGTCHRAPTTTSTTEAVTVSLGGVEQEIMEAIGEGRPGFNDGWVSSIALNKLLEARGDKRRVPHNKRREILTGLGFVTHPGLHDGRVNVLIPPEGGKPRLWILAESPAASLTEPAMIVKEYCAAQGW